MAYKEAVVWDGLKNEDMSIIEGLVGPSIRKSPVAGPKVKKAGRKHGKVVHYRADKGYGFISSGINRYFFHISACDEMDTVEIPVGLSVTFELGEDKHGKPCAVNVR